MVTVSLTRKEFDMIKEILGSEIVKMGDYNEEDSERFKLFDKLDDKLTRTLNKNGIYYLWQLKDRDKGVVPGNIKDEWC